MIQDASLVGSSHPRKQLPAGLLPLILDASRRGEREMTIAVCDQLAPAYGSNDTVLTYSRIEDFIGSLCGLCPPASPRPVVTMAPDHADRGEHSPDTIRNQWRQAIDSSSPKWSGLSFDAIDRNEFYDRLPYAAAVVQTLSDEPYANLLLTVDPAASESLRKIPDIVCLGLAEALSRAGHSHAVVIAPSSHRHLFDLAPRALKREYNCSPSHIAEVISHLWLPDTHVQNPRLPLQRPLGIYCENTGSVEKATAVLGGKWSDPCLRQTLDLNEFQRELADRRVVVCIEATGSDATPDVCYTMKNWISGYNGGF